MSLPFSSLQSPDDDQVIKNILSSKKGEINDAYFDVFERLLDRRERKIAGNKLEIKNLQTNIKNLESYNEELIYNSSFFKEKLAEEVEKNEEIENLIETLIFKTKKIIFWFYSKSDDASSLSIIERESKIAEFILNDSTGQENEAMLWLEELEQQCRQKWSSIHQNANMQLEVEHLAWEKRQQDNEIEGLKRQVNLLSRRANYIKNCDILLEQSSKANHTEALLKPPQKTENTKSRNSSTRTKYVDQIEENSFFSKHERAVDFLIPNRNKDFRKYSGQVQDDGRSWKHQI